MPRNPSAGSLGLHDCLAAAQLEAFAFLCARVCDIVHVHIVINNNSDGDLLVTVYMEMTQENQYTS